MNSTFKIDIKRKIILETLAGDITTDEYIKMKHEEFLHKDFNRNFNLVADFRKCEEAFDVDDLQYMINIFSENKGKINREKSALVFSDTSLLRKIDLSGNNPDKPQEIEVFTDIDEAVKWVLS